MSSSYEVKSSWLAQFQVECEGKPLTSFEVAIIERQRAAKWLRFRWRLVVDLRTQPLLLFFKRCLQVTMDVRYFLPMNCLTGWVCDSRGCDVHDGVWDGGGSGKLYLFLSSLGISIWPLCRLWILSIGWRQEWLSLILSQSQTLQVLIV